MRASERRLDWRLANLGLIASLAAACGSISSPQTATPAAASTTIAAASTAVVSPWILLDAAAPPAVREATEAWATGVGREVQVQSLADTTGEPPDGLWAVVGLEENLMPLNESWRGGPPFLVVLDPASLNSGETISTVGPEVAYDQAGFLAGVAAGLATQSGLVGLLPGAAESDGWRMGFGEGLLYSCPKCQLEDVSDPGQPAFAMDVIGRPPASQSSVGPPGADPPWLVVFEQVPDGWGERVAARVQMVPQALIGPALAALDEGKPGMAWVFAAADGGLVTAVDPRAISPGRERLLREAEALLASGMLVVGGGR